MGTLSHASEEMSNSDKLSVRARPVLSAFEKKIGASSLPPLAPVQASPGLTQAAAAQIAAYESDLNAVSLVLCLRCSRRYPCVTRPGTRFVRAHGIDKCIPLVEALERCHFCMRGAPKTATATEQPDLYTEANMNYPGPPRGRHADRYWTAAVAAEAGLSDRAAKESFFKQAQELFARASFAEELLVTRFRTYMVVRRAPQDGRCTAKACA